LKTVRLITNDFKITRHKDHGVIYNYRVDFAPGKATGGKPSTFVPPDTTSAQGKEEKIETSTSRQTDSTDLTLLGGELENYQKFKIVGMLREQIKQIFGLHVYVG